MMMNGMWEEEIHSWHRARNAGSCDSSFPWTLHSVFFPTYAVRTIPLIFFTHHWLWTSTHNSPSCPESFCKKETMCNLKSEVSDWHHSFVILALQTPLRVSVIRIYNSLARVCISIYFWIKRITLFLLKSILYQKTKITTTGSILANWKWVSSTRKPKLSQKGVTGTLSVSIIPSYGLSVCATIFWAKLHYLPKVSSSRA